MPTCFSPDGALAYFADTPERKIERVALDPETGKPAGDWEVFVDLGGQPGFPDGAVCDSEGFVWSAEYGGGRVVRYAPDGRVDRVVTVPAPNVTCPCFGGDDLKTPLYHHGHTGHERGASGALSAGRQRVPDKNRRARPGRDAAKALVAVAGDAPGTSEIGDGVPDGEATGIGLPIGGSDAATLKIDPVDHGGQHPA